MKNIIFALVFFASAYTNAAVYPLGFHDDRATLVVQGADSDAISLFEALNVEFTIEGNTQRKYLVYQSFFGEEVFEILCQKSLLIEAASCTITFFSPGTLIDKNSQSLLMGVNNRLDAAWLAEQFHTKFQDQYQAEVFTSLDNRFRIRESFDIYGEVAAFTVTYN